MVNRLSIWPVAGAGDAAQRAEVRPETRRPRLIWLAVLLTLTAFGVWAQLYPPTAEQAARGAFIARCTSAFSDHHFAGSVNFWVSPSLRSVSAFLRAQYTLPAAH